MLKKSNIQKSIKRSNSLPIRKNSCQFRFVTNFHKSKISKPNPEDQYNNFVNLASEYLHSNYSNLFSNPLLANQSEFKNNSEYSFELQKSQIHKINMYFRTRWASFCNILDSLHNIKFSNMNTKILVFINKCMQKIQENIFFDIKCPASVKVRKPPKKTDPKSEKTNDQKNEPDPKIIKKPKINEEQKKIPPAFSSKDTTKKDKTHLKFIYRCFTIPIIPFEKIDLEPIPLKPTFIILGPYTDIKENLLKRGWLENPKEDSTAFNLKWSLKTKHLNHETLREGQIVNHFQKITEVSTKIGLMQNLKNYQWTHGVDIDNFHPITYDLADIEVPDFIQEFKCMKAESILRNFVVKPSLHEISIAKLLISINIAQRRILDFMQVSNYEFMHLNGEIVSKDEWEILTVHKTLEQKMLHKDYPDFEKRISNFLNKYKSNELAEKVLLAKINEILPKYSQKYPQHKINGLQNLWIVKPAGLSRGRGITVLSDLKRILDFSKTKHYIVQKYIENPLIVCKRKFDIRQWVLISSFNPLKVWIFHEMYLRFSAEEYSTDLISSKFMHLTNNSIMKHYEQESIIKGNMWSQSQFIEYLKKEYKFDVWNTKILPKVKQIIIHSLKASQPKIIHRGKAFEILGYDFMIDDLLDPWLIEVNASPAVDYSTVFF